MNRKGEAVINIILMIITILCVGTFVANLFVCDNTMLLIINEVALALIIYSLLATLKERVNKV